MDILRDACGAGEQHGVNLKKLKYEVYDCKCQSSNFFSTSLNDDRVNEIRK